MPRMRVLVGTSPETLQPIEANTSRGSYRISTDKFDGEIAVYLKDFLNEDGDASTSSDYFSHPDRRHRTWSIQVRGRFLSEHITGDDLLFGNIFDRPLHLPYGSSAVLKLMKMKDPTLEYDLACDKPWALSPFISTMRYLSCTTVSPGDAEQASFTRSAIVIKEDTTAIAPTASPSPDARRAHFESAENRRDVRFGPSTLIQSDFCHGYLEFAKGEGLELSLPMVKFDLMKYWDGRPVWFVCCERRRDGMPGPGDSVFCVGFEIIVDT